MLQNRGSSKYRAVDLRLLCLLETTLPRVGMRTRATFFLGFSYDGLRAWSVDLFEQELVVSTMHWQPKMDNTSQN